MATSASRSESVLSVSLEDPTPGSMATSASRSESVLSVSLEDPTPVSMATSASQSAQTFLAPAGFTPTSNTPAVFTATSSTPEIVTPTSNTHARFTPTSNKPGHNSTASTWHHAAKATVLQNNFTDEELSYSSDLMFGTTSLPTVSCHQVLCETEPRHYLVNSTFCRTHSSAFDLVSENVPATLEIRTLPTNDMNNIYCKGTIRAPGDRHTTTVTLQLTSEVRNISVEVGENDKLQAVYTSLLLTSGVSKTLYNREIQLVFRGHASDLTSSLTVRFFSYLTVLPSRRLSATAGSVTSPGLGNGNGNGNYPNNYDGTFFIEVPENHSVWFRFNRFQIGEMGDCTMEDHVTLREMTRNRTQMSVWRKCGMKYIPLTIVHNSLLLEFHSDGYDSLNYPGFKMTYAVIPDAHQLALLPTGRYNCSAPHYHELHELFSCNLIQECEGNEDEKKCEYSGQACGVGAMEAGSKCLTLAGPVPRLTWQEASKACQDKQQSLFEPKDPDTQRALNWLIKEQGLITAHIGLQLRQSYFPLVLSAMYRHIMRWGDGTTAFVPIVYVFANGNERFPIYCAELVGGLTMSISCYTRLPFPVHIVCEFDKPGDHVSPTTGLKTISLDESASAYEHLTMVTCPEGHVTRTFLTCDQQSQCGAKVVMTSCQVETREVAMFVCDDGGHSLPYSMVCDHIPHCSDKSDEDFCHHNPCPPALFPCRNGQCVSSNSVCDSKLDCYDGSDEMCQIKLRIADQEEAYPVIVQLRYGTFRTKSAPQHCPTTHFPCRAGNYLIPVYLRCNGVPDCVSQEDEEDCGSYTCPGYYRCRGSSVCVHPVNMCDGIFHCPQFDDELLCEELTCPEACECQELAFVCSAANFSVSAFPELRYLDVSGTAMSPQRLSNNLKLVRVSLSDTRLTEPPTLALPNLRHLDLSYNEIAIVNLQAFGFLTNLRVLVLRGNPLMTFVSVALPQSDLRPLQNALLSYGDSLVTSTDSLALLDLDVSHTQVETYNGSVFTTSPLLKHLNLSHTKLHTITQEGFKSTSELELLDVRGSPVKHFPIDLLRNLAGLKTVYADNFKLCCQLMLPEDFDTRNCYAAQNVLASCEDLLRSNTYRVFLWIFAALSVAGNAGSFVTRLYLTKRAKGLGSFDVFVTNLCVADFLMGGYLIVIGAADLTYQGEYLWFDDQWKESIACSVAGFLSLLSSEVSAFIICLITLDRFIVLRYPFSRFRFRKRSALLACSFVWAAGIFLASVPLLPSTSHWRFYSQTGICIPLPFSTGEQFRGRVYSLSVMIAVNFALFLLIAVGQVGIYWSVRRNSIASSSRSTTSRDAALARRLTSVVVSDFLCWFPIGLLGLLSYTGTPIPGEVNVGVAIFVLPLNAALNPFLYTFNVLMEKYRRAMRHYNSGGSNKADWSSKEAVFDQLKVWMANRTISVTDIVTAFIREDTPQSEIDVWRRSLISNKNTGTRRSEEL